MKICNVEAIMQNMQRRKICNVETIMQNKQHKKICKVETITQKFATSENLQGRNYHGKYVT